MRFYPKALIVTAAGVSLIGYALEHQVGLVFIATDLLLTGGLWALLPERWPSDRTRASHH